MTEESTDSPAQSDPRELLEVSSGTRELLDQHGLRPLWEVEAEFGHVIDDLEADIWTWKDVQAVIDSIENDVPIEELPPGFRRRVAVPINTAIGTAISNTIYVGIQTVSPGETAPSHRHSANAFRFTVEGHTEMKTVVAGEEFPMEANDLITTPQWEWHDHVNEGDETATWLDVLDLPLFLDSLDRTQAFENHELDRQPVTKSAGYWASQYGSGRPANESSDAAIPGPFEGIREATPPYRFAWEEMRESLRQRAENDDRDPHDGYSLAYVNPATGTAPLFPSMSPRMQLLHETTEPHFHNAVEVYFAVDGSGVTHVGETALEWQERDLFVVPPDEVHHHEPDGEAILLGMSDRPLLEALNFYAEAEPS